MLRTNLYWITLVLVTALVEVTWLGAIRIGGVVPDVILLLVVYFGMTNSSERAMLTGVIGGIIQDVASGTGLGHHVLALAVAGYVAGMLAERLLIENPAVKAGMVLFACIVHGFVYVTVDFIQNPEISAVDAILVSMIPRTFYTMLITPVVFFLLDRVLGDRMPAPRRVQRD